MEKILKRQKKLFERSISFVASENYSFYNLYDDLINTDIGNRYSFFNNTRNNDSFPWHENILEIQEKTTNLLKNILSVDFVTISPLSWMNALFILLSSLSKINDSIFLVSPENWWHFSSKFIAERLGLRVNFIPFAYKSVDYDKFLFFLKKEKPSLIYVDQMTWIYPISMLPIYEYTKRNNIINYYDISHNWAFVFSWLHKHPLQDWYDVFGWSTHKTIPWPIKAYFAGNNSGIFNKIFHFSNILVSSNNSLGIWMLLITLNNMENKWFDYTKKILKNSNYMAKKLEELWFEIIYDGKNYTKNHQVLFRSDSIISSKKLFDLLNSILIFTNLLPLPFTKWKIWIRIWTQEFSFLWWWYEEIDSIIFIIKDLIKFGEINKDENVRKIGDVKKKLMNSGLGFLK